jgi:hypothetical protein
MKISDWIQICLAVITLIGIFRAFSDNNKQIKTSNKQVLFDKRLDVFMIAEGFKQLVKENKIILEKPKEPELRNGIIFHCMINNTYLNELSDVIPAPLERDVVSPLDNPEAHRNFLIKKEEILKKAQTAELIFEKPENLVISKFIYDYVTLLDGRRCYGIALKGFREDEKQYPPDLTTEEYLENYTDEKKRCQKLIIEPINSLSDSYKKYCGEQTKIKSQISLKRGRK